MPAGSRVVGRTRGGLTVLSIFLSVSVGSFWSSNEGRAIQATEAGAGSSVRVAHGIADAGPLDVYIDGLVALIGIVFGETSGDLLLRAGEHEFAVVPTGATPDEAIAAGTIALQDDSDSYATLLGTVEEASVGLFAIDHRPLDAGRARFRVISGVPDAGGIVPVFAGGDALSEPLGFGDATEYAAIDAGVFDLEMLEAESGVSLLALPQTPFAAGTTIDLILVGQVSDGSLRALIESVDVEVAPVLGRSAHLFTGACGGLEEVAADLGIVQMGQGESVGAEVTESIAQGFGLAAIPFATLVASPHAVAISEAEDQDGGVVACGDIGGRLTDTGALVVALQTTGAIALGGVAVLAPAVDDPGATGVSVFLLAEAAASGVAATPETTSQ